MDVIGWVLLSREAVARAEEALSSDQKGVRDEVGFLAIHQGFADRFFPGTSVLHTRLRYALFVPWLMQRAAAGGGSDPARRLSAAEIALAGQLTKGPDPDGVIGGRVYPKPTAQPPSMSYWSALGAWGILRSGPDGMTPSRTGVMRLLGQRPGPRRTRASDVDGVRMDEGPASPFVQLPPAPPALGVRGQPLDFTLTPVERKFLREHLLGVFRPGTEVPSLLSRLAEAGTGHEAEHPWMPEVTLHADGEDRKALDVARQAASLAGIGRAVYSALAEIAHAGDGLSESRIHRDHLCEMKESHGRDARRIDLGRLRALLPDHLSEDLVRVLSETLDWIAARDPDPSRLRGTYARAEQGRKGLRARLPDNVAGKQRRAEWDPKEHPLAELLHFRWRNARRLLADLAAA